MQSVISIEDIQKIVVAYYNLSMNDFLSARRSRHIARPDKLQCIYQKLTTKSLPKLGENLRAETTLLLFMQLKN